VLFTQKMFQIQILSVLYLQTGTRMLTSHHLSIHSIKHLKESVSLSLILIYLILDADRAGC
jgi:hypothetical protein